MTEHVAELAAFGLVLGVKEFGEDPGLADDAPSLRRVPDLNGAHNLDDVGELEPEMILEAGSCPAYTHERDGAQ